MRGAAGAAAPEPAWTAGQLAAAGIAAVPGRQRPRPGRSHEITRRDITAHPLRFVTTWRPGRHYPRFTIKKVRTRKSNDVVPAATRLHLPPLPATPG